VAAPDDITQAEKQLLDLIVAKYESDIKGFERLAKNLHLLLSELPPPLVHSLRARAKDPTHLHRKLVRKLQKNKKDGEAFQVTPDNLAEKINDLAGIRLLHLHTSQFPQINTAMLELLTNEGYLVKEGPVARVWDDEYKGIFATMGIKTVANERMYTSVHYVVEESTRSKRTAEIQVRTLAEELWGEVDHSLNYPDQCDIPSCREQIKVLARATSACTRLVDSIYHTKSDAEAHVGRVSEGKLPRPPHADKVG
jgi:ppGpp synthetase/RelA/SpoT-type nucleotidyltranferase